MRGRGVVEGWVDSIHILCCPKFLRGGWVVSVVVVVVVVCIRNKQKNPPSKQSSS